MEGSRIDSWEASYKFQLCYLLTVSLGQEIRQNSFEMEGELMQTTTSMDQGLYPPYYPPYYAHLIIHLIMHTQ